MPTIIFFDGFETGDYSKWTSTWIMGSNTLSVQNVAHRGKYGLTSHNVGDGTSFVQKQIAAQTTVYVRVYVRFSVLPTGIGQGVNFIELVTPGHTLLVVSFICTDGVNYAWHVTNGATGLAKNSSNEEMKPDMWYCIEVKFVVHATDGEIRVYRNGEEVLTWTGINTGTFTVTYLNTGSEYTTPYTIDTYIDDVVIADSYIGILPLLTSLRSVSHAAI